MPTNRFRFAQSQQTDPRDAQIARLEDQLLEVRYLVLRLMPDPFPELFRGYYNCDSREEGRQWVEDLVEKVIEAATPVEGTWNGLTQSAYCPLCGDGSSSPYAKGYTLPEGLRRHLTGWGNTSECHVMEVVRALAHARWNDKFAAAEAAEKKAGQDRRTERLATESLYLIDPNLPAVLIDEGQWFSRPHRKADGEGTAGIRWAEDRLSGLGFKKVVDGRTHSFVARHQNAKGAFLAYGDPRPSSEIRVRVFGLTPKGNPTNRQIADIEIRDSWKNGLPAKLAAAIDKATRAAS